MKSFAYYNRTHLEFGRGRHNEIGALIKPFCGGKKVLLHYGGGSIKRTGLYGDITASLAAAGIAFIELGGVRPNPAAELARAGIALCRSEDVGLILAVGGGSAIDSSKAIAMGTAYAGDVWEIFDKRLPAPEGTLPVAAVLTIPAAGSEASADAVLSEGDEKKGYSDPHIRTCVSVIDPDLFATVPKNQIANGLCDMMSHTLERYFTFTDKADFFDGYCESMLRTMMKYAPRLIADPADTDAWENVVLASYFVHCGVAGLGREQGWSCHPIELELSAADPKIAHGAGLAVLTPAWMRHVWRQNREMFVQFAVNVMGVAYDRDEDFTAAQGIDRFAAFLKALGLPATLRELGMDAPDVPAMARHAVTARGGSIPGMVTLSQADVEAIFNACL